MYFYESCFYFFYFVCFHKALKADRDKANEADADKWSWANPLFEEIAVLETWKSASEAPIGPFAHRFRAAALSPSALSSLRKELGDGYLPLLLKLLEILTTHLEGNDSMGAKIAQLGSMAKIKDSIKQEPHEGTTTSKTSKKAKAKAAK